MVNYLFLTRNANGNMRYSATADVKPRRPRPTLLYRMKDFLTNNVLAWIFHNWHIKKPFAYPTEAGESIHPLTLATDRVEVAECDDTDKGVKQDGSITLCVTGDWATSTPQAAFIGRQIACHQPDYTIHLGDTYYSGADDELADNYLTGASKSGIWPRGGSGSFALLGNHEMYSSGGGFYRMIKDPASRFGIRNPVGNTFTGQPVPFFCLSSDHWTIVGLDTGYDSLQRSCLKRLINIHPTNLQLQLPDLQLRWLRENPDVLNPKKGIVLLSHHQYISAFGGENEFAGPAVQMQPMLGNREVLWLWGHEHRFAMYDKYAAPGGITANGRCIGNGSMMDEHLKERLPDPAKAVSRRLALYDYRVADTFHFDSKAVDVGYNGYARLAINGDGMEITYFQAYWNGDPKMKEFHQAAVRENWRADGAGNVTRISFGDLTKDPMTRQSGLSYSAAGRSW